MVLPNPGYPANAALAESLGIAVRYYNLRAENRFHIDPDEIRRLVDRDTRLLIVNSPNNPTGAVLSDEEMDSLHDLCAERRVQFVSDQVYHPIYHGPETRTAARLPCATVISDFSKALCLSGLRIGWMIEPDARRREHYRNARSHFTVSGTVLGERLATLALQHRDTIYDRTHRISRVNLPLLDRLFAEHADLLRWVRPAGGMTGFPWLAGGANTREFCRSLAQSGVLMAPGDCFGMPAHFRIGFAASGEGFSQGIVRLAEFLRAAGRRSSLHA